jgi:hypothetical protein
LNRQPLIVLFAAVFALVTACAEATSDTGAGPSREPDTGGRRDAGGRPGPADGGTGATDTIDDDLASDGSGAPDTGAADSGDDAVSDSSSSDTATDSASGDTTSVPDVDPDAVIDGGGVYDPEVPGPIDPEICPAESIVPTLCIAAVDEYDADLCDGFDNDCDGVVDESCVCKLGDVQSCFAGPPGRVDEGACEPGTQRCVTGAGGDYEWGDCTGGISPRPEVCDTLDNDCNGCIDELGFCAPGGSCPGPGDIRTPDATPFVAYPLRGSDFYTGPSSAWSWSIVGGPCDDIVPGRRSFELTGANTENATFTPSLSGSYTVTLRVTTPDGVFECTWVIHVVGPGIRIEMCYPESMTQDNDLMIMRTTTAGNWYGPSGDVFSPNPSACSWWNCEANIRGFTSRVDWGYANTDIANCTGGPQGDQWRRLGYCANPRLDIDNNLSEGTGLPENINIDNPRSGDAYRIMVHNFSGSSSRPIVNVYCGGRLMATFGAAPDFVTGFAGARAQVGAMWRVADVLAIVDGSGDVYCEVTALHPPGAGVGYDVSVNDSRF